MEHLLKWNDDLAGAPSGVLIMFFAIALGYLLKTLPFYDNKYIPLVVVLGCVVGFMLIAPARSPETSARIYWCRNFIIGFIIGFAAWTFHAQILRRWVDPKLFPEDSKNNQPTKDT